MPTDPKKNPRESSPLAKSPIPSVVKTINKGLRKVNAFADDYVKTVKRGANKVVSAPSRFSRNIKNTIKQGTKRYF